VLRRMVCVVNASHPTIRGCLNIDTGYASVSVDDFRHVVQERWVRNDMPDECVDFSLDSDLRSQKCKSWFTNNLPADFFLAAVLPNYRNNQSTR
jgi:hypothetical protein